jgi:hypothetical protein
MELKKGKHVIFLGAGASCGSGYPLANDLRLLISSRKKWENALSAYESKHGIEAGLLTKSGLNYWDYQILALNLFREGGFATVDEFCKLAGGSSFKAEINNLRSFLRAVLGLFNPEESFEKSEYYGFVQSLFNEDLFTLRDDVTILSYNYDPYLEFLLFRAIEQRRLILRKDKSMIVSPEDAARDAAFANSINAATSGFGSLDDLKWLSDTNDSFSVLKLHGSIVCAPNQRSDFDLLFRDDGTSVLKRSLSLFRNKGEYIPPILFPWEIMDSEGIAKQIPTLFSGIWERARREVLKADKISFVGLSMHPFMFDGLKYLFNGRGGQAEIVVANAANTLFVPNRVETHFNLLPNSPAYIVSRDILGKFAPNLKIIGIPTGNSSPTSGEVTILKDFSDFIRTQMKPFSVRPVQ